MPILPPHPFSYVIRWLGQNSKQNRLARQLGDIQVRMRLVVSGDRTEIRQSYVPAMYSHIVRPLVEDGAVCRIFVVHRMLLSADI